VPAAAPFAQGDSAAAPAAQPPRPEASGPDMQDGDIDVAGPFAQLPAVIGPAVTI